MAVVMMVDNPAGSQEVYDKLRAHLGIDTPAGDNFHVAGPSPTGGFRVIELWESEATPGRSCASASRRRCPRSVCLDRRRRSSSGPCTTP